MNFEYNGNLLEEERINLVANEIINKYPQISITKAKEAAMLEGKISTNKTVNDELSRLYNIMLVNSDDKKIVAIIYNDFINILRNNTINNDHNKFYYIAESIHSFLNSLIEFPYLSDFK